jgi:hypothetical protein
VGVGAPGRVHVLPERSDSSAAPGTIGIAKITVAARHLGDVAGQCRVEIAQAPGLRGAEPYGDTLEPQVEVRRMDGSSAAQ